MYVYIKPARGCAQEYFSWFNYWDENIKIMRSRWTCGKMTFSVEYLTSFFFFKALITSKLKVFPETLLHLLGYLSFQKNNEWVLTVKWVHTGSLTSEVRHESQHRMEEFYCHLSWQEISLPSASTPTDLVSGVEKSAAQRLCQLGFLLASIHCVCVQDEPLKSSSLIWSWVEEGCVCVCSCCQHECSHC